MAMDQHEQYRQDAEAFRRGANLMEFFAALAEQKGDTAAVEQIGHYKDVNLEMAALYDQLATAPPDA